MPDNGDQTQHNRLAAVQMYKLTKEIELAREEILASRPSRAKLAEQMSQRLSFPVTVANVNTSLATLGIEYVGAQPPRGKGSIKTRAEKVRQDLEAVKEELALVRSVVDDQAAELRGLRRQLEADHTALGLALQKLGLAKPAVTDTKGLTIVPKL